MHEWALAEAVITAATQIAAKEKLKQITEITIKIGELQQVETDILEFAFQQLKPANLKNTKFHIKNQKATLKCRVCGNTWLFARQQLDPTIVEAIHFIPETAHTYLKCPKCSSPDFEITEGRGIQLEKVTGVR